MSDRVYAKVQAQQKTLIGASPKSGHLQRTCVCGGSPGIDGLCTVCRDKRLTSQSSRRGFEAPTVSTAAQSNSPAQENVTSLSAVVDRASRFGHDFSRIPIHSSVPRTIQMPQTGSGAGDGHTQEAGSVTYDTAGKPAAPFSMYLGISRSTPFQVACRNGGERTYAEISNEMIGGNGPKSPEATAPKPDAKPKPAPKPELKPEEAKIPTKPTITPQTTFSAPDGTGKKRTNVGVGEEVTFTGNAVGKWTATYGTPRELASGAKFTWTAPDKKATVTIKLQVGTEEATLSMNVIQPAYITAHKKSEIVYPSGMAGAGMKLTLSYHPMNVSFGNVLNKEVSGDASNITGYFDKEQFSKAVLKHNSSDAFHPIQENNMDGAVDNAFFHTKLKPYEKGTFDWIIPNKFKVKTETGDGRTYTVVTQEFLMVDATGKIKITKAGAEVERSP